MMYRKDNDSPVSTTVDRHPTSRSCVRFLRSFLPAANESTVFTHGNLKKSKIRVDKETGGITGITGWGRSGFYPDYWEAERLYFDRSEEDEWYLYIPQCISPLKHPERWLLARVWELETELAIMKRDEDESNKEENEGK